MAHEVETMFSARHTPWHGLGTVTPDVLTAADAIIAGGLDWEVSLHSTYVQIGKNKKKIPNRYAIVRDMDESIYNVVGTKYHLFQNREAFDFADGIRDSGEAVYETAGSLRGGKVIFLTMKLQGTFNVAGEDAHDLYLVLRASHDGLSAITAYVTPIRVVCMNTMTMASAAAKYRWSIPHTSTIKGKIQEARETLKLSFEYADEFLRLGTELAGIKIGRDDFVSVLDSVIPLKPKTPEVVQDILDLYDSSPTNGYNGTAWGALNAITEYFDHGRDTRSEEAVFTNIMNGQISGIRNKATKRLLALA